MVVSQLKKKNSVRLRDVQSDQENWNQMKSGIFMHVLLASLLHLWCFVDGMILAASRAGTCRMSWKGHFTARIVSLFPEFEGLAHLRGNNWFHGIVSWLTENSLVRCHPFRKCQYQFKGGLPGYLSIHPLYLADIGAASQETADWHTFDHA